MNLSRREFFAAGGALAATVFVPGRLVLALEQQAPAPVAFSKWVEVRDQFRLAPGFLHFASFYIASHPRPVRDAIESFRKTLDAQPFLTVEHGLFESEAENLQLRVCHDIASYLGARPEEIALTPNTTTGLALVHHGLPLRNGDEVLTTAHDHYSHHESIRLAAERSGASVRRVTLYEKAADAEAGTIVERLVAAIRPATRVVGITWVHSGTGVRLPIRAIADAIAGVNRRRAETDRVRLVVDGVHGLGVVDEDVATMGCDYFCAGTHKWIFAPRGTGIVWANSENWARLRPTIPTFSSLDSYQAWMQEKPPAGPTTAARVTPGGFQSYEHQWAMGAAFRFHEQIGRRRIAGRIRELNDQCKSALARLPRVKIHTPIDPAVSAGIVAFEVDGLPPDQVVKKLLERRVVASTSPYRVPYVRLAPSVLNTPEEVDAAVRALRDIAVT